MLNVKFITATETEVSKDFFSHIMTYTSVADNQKK